jgi:hypothetical protein
MNTKRKFGWPVLVALAVACTLTVILLMTSWGKKTQAQDKAQVHVPVHMTTDWSNRHMVYSTPSSLPQAWRLQMEPRYLQQWTRRNAPATQAQPVQ